METIAGIVMNFPLIIFLVLLYAANRVTNKSADRLADTDKLKLFNNFKGFRKAKFILPLFFIIILISISFKTMAEHWVPFFMLSLGMFIYLYCYYRLLYKKFRTQDLPSDFIKSHRKGAVLTVAAYAFVIISLFGFQFFHDFLQNRLYELSIKISANNSFQRTGHTAARR